MALSTDKLEKLLAVIKKITIGLLVLAPIFMVATYFTPAYDYIRDPIMIATGIVFGLLGIFLVARLFLYCLIAWIRKEISVPGEWHGDEGIYSGKTARFIAAAGMLGALFFLFWIIVIVIVVSNGL